nr:hypothetical protein [uncultured Flavobacterium sp.]
MEIEIVENKKQSLYVYENDELLFYSIIDFKWTKKNIVKVFDSKSDLMFEVESQKLPFRFQKIKILFQKTKKEKNINALNYNYILFNEN